MSSLKNLIEEWDVRKFSLPKIDKSFKGEDDSNHEFYTENKSNALSYNLLEEENVIKVELDKRLIIFLPAK